MTRRHALRVVTHAMEKAGERTRAEADGLLEQELDRLGSLQAAVWDSALDGDIKSVRAALALIQERAKLLGLYAPTKSEVRVEGTMTDEEVLIEARRLGLVEDHDDRASEEGGEVPAR